MDEVIRVERDYPESFQPELAKTVVGHRIVKVEGDRVWLDNGETFEVDGSSDCCAWAAFEVDATSLANTEHVITHVEEQEIHDGDEYASRARWFIMADTHKVLDIDGEWDASNGYYFYGFNLTVRKAE